MDADDRTRALQAISETVTALGLRVNDIVVLQNSNKLALRLLPCDIVARVAPIGREAAAAASLEIELALRCAATVAPVALLAARVEPRVYECDGFAATLWTHYDETSSGPLSAAGYARGLERLHAGIGNVDVAAPHFLDRVEEARSVISNVGQSPALDTAGRALLLETLGSVCGTIQRKGATEQLIHGEPHPGNVLNTDDGPVFIDLETCCRGPVEFDWAHVPPPVNDLACDVDHELVNDCRQLVLAMVAAWRWDVRDQFPDGLRHGRAILDHLRHGPPWPTVGEFNST